MGIVLSGGDRDGALGLQAISQQGGTALVQNLDEAYNPSMPYMALVTDHPEVLFVDEIAERVRVFC